MRRLEQGKFAASQIFFKGSKIEALLYLDGLPLFLGLGLAKRLKCSRYSILARGPMTIPL